jgi:hypothetical protein
LRPAARAGREPVLTTEGSRRPTGVARVERVMRHELAAYEKSEKPYGLMFGEARAAGELATGQIVSLDGS